MSDDKEIESRSERVRSIRNDCLQNSDWTHHLEDRPVENKNLWALYRRKLRDLPTRPDFPFIEIEHFPQNPDSPYPEYDKYRYVESRSYLDSAWELNPDWVEPEEIADE